MLGNPAGRRIQQTRSPRGRATTAYVNTPVPIDNEMVAPTGNVVFRMPNSRGTIAYESDAVSVKGPEPGIVIRAVSPGLPDVRTPKSPTAVPLVVNVIVGRP